MCSAPEFILILSHLLSNEQVNNTDSIMIVLHHSTFRGLHTNNNKNQLHIVEHMAFIVSIYITLTVCIMGSWKYIGSKGTVVPISEKL